MNYNTFASILDCFKHETEPSQLHQHIATACSQGAQMSQPQRLSLNTAITAALAEYRLAPGEEDDLLTMLSEEEYKKILCDLQSKCGPALLYSRIKEAEAQRPLMSNCQQTELDESIADGLATYDLVPGEEGQLLNICDAEGEFTLG